MINKNTDQKVHREVAFELKNLDDDGEGVFEGYASTFGGNPDGHNEVIDKGAFTKTLRTRGPKVKGGPNVLLLWQHDIASPIGVILELREDDIGLYIKAKLTLAVQKAMEARALMLDKAIDSMSIGFRIVESTYNSETGILTIHEIRLYEISLVSLPANESAVVTGVKSVRDWEKTLRDAGLSRNDAKVGAKALTEVLDLRDAGTVDKAGFWDSPEVRDALKRSGSQADTKAAPTSDLIKFLGEGLAKTG